MEKQLLPDAALKPAYSKVVWLYVFRDFSKSVEDRAAERISLRFGLTSWPQHLLVDPESLQVVGNTGRTANGFLSAVNRAGARVKPSQTFKAADRVRQADTRAIELENNPTVGLARKYVDDSDIVVRFRALDILAEQEPKIVAARARQLLLVPNDPFRYAVCKVLSKTGNIEAADALQELVKRPINSRNPNVLRSNAVIALGACGGKESVAVIAPFASSGQYLNGLTGTSVGALVAIAVREPGVKKTVCDVLKRSFPQPPANPTEIQKRYCVRLAKQVHAALEQLSGQQVVFPKEYNRASRAMLIESW